MYVSVLYYHPEIGEGGSYTGKAYTYFTRLPLKPYDKVICSTYSGKTKAIVCRVGIPFEDIQEDIRPRLREIDEYDV